MHLSLSVDFHFSAAHQLPLYDGPCKRMHGHNYRLQVTLTGPVSPKDGMIRDFEEVKRRVYEAALVRCDHHCLNDVLENPTAENVASWLWERLSPRETGLPGLTELKLWENPDYCVTVRAASGG